MLTNKNQVNSILRLA